MAVLRHTETNWVFLCLLCFFCFTEGILNLPVVLKQTERPQTKCISTADHTHTCMLRWLWHRFASFLSPELRGCVEKSTNSSLLERGPVLPEVSESDDREHRVCQKKLKLHKIFVGNWQFNVCYWVTRISATQKLFQRIENNGKHWCEINNFPDNTDRLQGTKAPDLQACHSNPLFLTQKTTQVSMSL